MKSSNRVQAPDDPPQPASLPALWKSRLDDVEQELSRVTAGGVRRIAASPGGLPVYAVAYGDQDDLRHQANYGSALGAGNPAYYAPKTAATKPVVFFLGPVHGQEVEPLAAMVNLIHIMETGADHRGREWPGLRAEAAQCRIIVVPCANPDGRRRVPYDSFLGLPLAVMTKYGQGTHTDGTLWGWPDAKSVHPMRGDVGILGGYFNDNGINPMHDDFFGRMAPETDAVMEIARSEAPDIIVSLHSSGDPPHTVPVSGAPLSVHRRVAEISQRVRARLLREGLPAAEALPEPDPSDAAERSGFNLASALHYVCGATAFTFECTHGTVSPTRPQVARTHDDLLDIALCLCDELLGYALENRVCWTP